MPDGADAVVMQEDTRALDGDRVRITDATVKPGQWVFARGHRDAGRRRRAAGRDVLNPAARRRAGRASAGRSAGCSRGRG